MSEQVKHGGYAAKVVAHSRNQRWQSIATLEITFPRFILAQFNTHRVFSRNAASSRAIPTAKLIERVETHPVMPVWWGKNQPGMHAREELDDAAKELAIRDWLEARDDAVRHAKYQLELGAHKEIVNRLIELWMWVTVIVTSTDWTNFFAQRCHSDAQPEFRKIADMMFEAYHVGAPARSLANGEWHLPYFTDVDRRDIPERDWKAVSVGRCTRVSYLNHDGVRDPEEDIRLHNRMMTETPAHWSPFEHVAMASSNTVRSRNFRGFVSYRAQVDTTSVEE